MVIVRHQPQSISVMMEIALMEMGVPKIANSKVDLVVNLMGVLISAK